MYKFAFTFLIIDTFITLKLIYLRVRTFTRNRKPTYMVMNIIPRNNFQKKYVLLFIMFVVVISPYPNKSII